MKLFVILGTRPEFIKVALTIKKLRQTNNQVLVAYTGQHYDYNLSGVFKEELELGDFDFNLHCQADLQGEQTAMILTAIERQLITTRPDMVVVLGDTNTTLAGALAAVKLGIPIAHIEAGCRCYDLTMPEEVNRRIVDSISSLLFAPTKLCVSNLVREGIGREHIVVVGYTQGELCYQYMSEKVQQSTILQTLGLQRKAYSLLTVHRQENSDVKKNLGGIVGALSAIKTKIVFPIHPRTNKRLREFNILSQLKNSPNVVLTEPLGYIDFLVLLSNAKIVITDSGGVQEESAMFKIPCIVLRERTELSETIKAGVSVLTGANKDRIVETANHILDDETLYRYMSRKQVYPPLNSSDLIVEKITSFGGW
jgi:UDP-N-acetylglucosamine 2-epimerase (non-hydrolysing)